MGIRGYSSTTPALGTVRFKKPHIAQTFEWYHKKDHHKYETTNGFPDDDPHVNYVESVELDGQWLWYLGWTRWVKYIAATSAVLFFKCEAGSYGDDGYILFAAALCKNTSLCSIRLLAQNEPPSRRLIVAFINALRLNPCREDMSVWCMDYEKNSFDYRNWFPDLKHIAETFDPPSMLEFLLCVDHDIENIRPKVY
ncbi:MAG: hypothetical protein ACOVQN_00660 [Exiguobacterium sp.]